MVSNWLLPKKLLQLRPATKICLCLLFSAPLYGPSRPLVQALTVLGQTSQPQWHPPCQQTILLLIVQVNLVDCLELINLFSHFVQLMKTIKISALSMSSSSSGSVTANSWAFHHSSSNLDTSYNLMTVSCVQINNCNRYLFSP